MIQKEFFDFQSAGESDQTAILTDDAVTRNKDRKRIIRTGGTYRTSKILRRILISSCKSIKIATCY